MNNTRHFIYICSYLIDNSNQLLSKMDEFIKFTNFKCLIHILSIYSHTTITFKTTEIIPYYEST
jgi:hypothetical protein